MKIESEGASVDVYPDPHTNVTVYGNGGISVSNPTHLPDQEESDRCIRVSMYVEDDPMDAEDREPTNAYGISAVGLTRDEARQLGEALIEASEAESEPLFQTTDGE